MVGGQHMNMNNKELNQLGLVDLLFRLELILILRRCLKVLGGIGALKLIPF